MAKVALSGASGNVGQVLRPALLARGIALRSADIRQITPVAPQEEVTYGDLHDPSAVNRLLDGVQVLIHLAGTSVERPLPEIIENNLICLHAVYEGARRNGVARIVFASSNHAFGMYPVADKLGIDCPFRPDGFYGLSKMWGEGVARLYWDKHGIESVCVRIGSMQLRPSEPRHLSTWLGHDDAVELMMRCIEAPEVGFLTVWGVSANARSYWRQEGAERLGYHPRQNAEDYAPEVNSRPNPLDAVAQRHQGGSFVSMDYTPPERRPSGAPVGRR
jgi:uronate dehydrogenase